MLSWDDIAFSRTVKMVAVKSFDVNKNAIKIYRNEFQPLAS